MDLEAITIALKARKDKGDDISMLLKRCQFFNINHPEGKEWTIALIIELIGE